MIMFPLLGGVHVARAGLIFRTHIYCYIPQLAKLTTEILRITQYFHNVIFMSPGRNRLHLVVGATVVPSGEYH